MSKWGGRGWRIYRIAFVTVNTVSFSHLTQFGFKKVCFLLDKHLITLNNICLLHLNLSDVAMVSCLRL